MTNSVDSELIVYGLVKLLGSLRRNILRVVDPINVLAPDPIGE
jgi:hypothetical protein